MRILKVCVGDPRSGIKGDAKLVVERTKRLERRGYVVDILYIVDNPWSLSSRLAVTHERDRVGLDIECRIGLLSMVRGLARLQEYSMNPIQTWFSYIARFGYSEKIKVIYSAYNLIHFYHIRSCGLIHKDLKSTPGVLDLIDSYTLNISNKIGVTRSWWLRLALREELRRIRRVERDIDVVTEGLAKCSVLTVTDKDAAYIGARLSKKVIIPVGVELSVNEEQRDLSLGRGGFSMIFFGNLNYEPNKNASRIIIAASRRIRERWGGLVRIVIAGRFISSNLRREALREGIEVYSPVSDMKALVESCEVAVLPMISGSGMQSKVLESIAWGCLLITTRRAAEPVGLVEGEEYLRAETANEIVERVEQLMKGDKKSDTIRRKALSRIKRLDWEMTVAQLCEVYEELLSRDAESHGC